MCLSRLAHAAAPGCLKEYRPRSSAARICLLGVGNSRRLGGFVIEAVGERETRSTLAPEDGAFRAPGGQGTEDDYPVSAYFANKNDAPRATIHADPPPLSPMAQANFAYRGSRYKVNPLRPGALLLVQPDYLKLWSRVKLQKLVALRFAALMTRGAARWS
jgi:hypothetical protein